MVILPETRKRRPGRGQPLIRLDDLPAWRGAAADRPDPVSEAVADHDLRQEQERRRLLYVAMTRAESWLIVAAAGDCGTGLESWHSMVAVGAERCALARATVDIDGIGPAQRLSFGDWTDLPVSLIRAPAPLVPGTSGAWSGGSVPRWATNRVTPRAYTSSAGR